MVSYRKVFILHRDSMNKQWTYSEHILGMTNSLESYKWKKTNDLFSILQIKLTNDSDQLNSYLNQQGDPFYMTLRDM